MYSIGLSSSKSLCFKAYLVKRYIRAKAEFCQLQPRLFVVLKFSTLIFFLNRFNAKSLLSDATSWPVNLSSSAGGLGGEGITENVVRIIWFSIATLFSEKH